MADHRCAVRIPMPSLVVNAYTDPRPIDVATAALLALQRLRLDQDLSHLGLPSLSARLEDSLHSTRCRFSKKVSKMLNQRSPILNTKFICFFNPELMLDDVLDVSSLQGVPGIIGTLLVALFADPAIGGSPAGIFFGGDFSLLWHQVLGAVCCCAWSAIFTFLVLSKCRQSAPKEIYCYSKSHDQSRNDEASRSHRRLCP